MRPLASRLRRRGRRYEEPALEHLSAEDHAYLDAGYDPSVPLPEDADHELRDDHPRLTELRRSYAALDLPVREHSRWRAEAIDRYLDLRYFRGETLFTWHYREPRRLTELKYYVWTRYVRDTDRLGLFDRLTEDGAFGCWHFDFEGQPRVSRDLLESIGELDFLDRSLRLADRERFSVLDIGAGYGRLAHRMIGAFRGVRDYACVDAIPEATFIAGYYLRYRGCTPPARVVPLDRIGDLAPGGFDLAVNVHTFSECTLRAIAWWAAELRRLEVPRLFLVPNEPEGMLSTEVDRTRRDFLPALESAGYRLAHREPVVRDGSVRELLQLRDHYHLFELAPSA